MIEEMSTLKKLMVVHQVSSGALQIALLDNINPCLFMPGVKKNLVSFKANIECVQIGSGDPSPSNIRTITGIQNIEVSHSNKNLWDGEYEEGIININTGTNNVSQGGVRSKNYIQVYPGMSVYLNYPKRGYGSNMRLFYYDQFKNYASNEWANAGQKIIPSGVYYIRFQFDSKFTYPLDADVSINCPYVYTDYTDHKGQIIQVSWEQQGAIYGGYVDFLEGKVYATHYYINANGTGINWSYTYQDGKSRMHFAPQTNGFPRAKGNGAVKFNYIKGGTGGTNLWTGYISSTGNILVYIDPEIDSADKWKDYLELENLQIVYEVDEPYVVTTFDPVNIQTFKNWNLIVSDNAGKLRLEIMFKQ